VKVSLMQMGWKERKMSTAYVSERPERLAPPEMGAAEAYREF